MRNWCKWMVKNRLGFLLKTLIVLSFPIQLASYCKEAWDDVSYTLKSVDKI